MLITKLILTAGTIVSVFVFSFCIQKYPETVLTDGEILQIIDENRPLKGAKIPVDLNKRLGSTHVGGKYYFTDEPFIIEGARKLHRMNYRVIKLWFTKNPVGYPYNSDWNLPKGITYEQLARHPYYEACFDLDFSTIVLMVGGAALKTTDESAAIEEEEIYELALYLLMRYSDRDVTFVIQNWEGDWLLRGGTGNHARWSRIPDQIVEAVDGRRYTVPVPADTTERVQTMIKWFTARQNGVNRARAEVNNSKCQVYHAIEANKVTDSMDGIPGIANYVLPAVETDMVSWSCYDGLKDNGVTLYKGIRYLQEQMKPTKYMKGSRTVFLGEIGIPEQRYRELTAKDTIIDRWDAFMGVCFALKVPYILQWQLYCNEPINEELRNMFEPRKTEEMRGFWLIRPDGTQSYAGEYFEKLLTNAGKRLAIP